MSRNKHHQGSHVGGVSERASVNSAVGVWSGKTWEVCILTVAKKRLHLERFQYRFSHWRDTKRNVRSKLTHLLTYCFNSVLLMTSSERHFCSVTFVIVIVLFSIFTALHGMQTPSSDENAVCPYGRMSVCLSVCETRGL